MTYALKAHPQICLHHRYFLYNYNKTGLIPSNDYISVYRMEIHWVVAIFFHFVNVWDVSVARAWLHVALSGFRANQAERTVKIQLNVTTIPISITRAQPPSTVNTFNSQVRFQCTIKYNIPETSQTKTAFALIKLRGTSQKVICLEFHWHTCYH